ncbi:MAG: nucleotidyl transferase AbiEii/AbiGii toxin family protein [Candidatus Cryptobacteroides sp.]
MEERLQLLDITSAANALPRLAVEKDWWVVIVLKALSQTSYAPLMSFKGGTSLSKGWNLIFRMSEDIDIAIRREGRFSISGTSKNQLAKARRVARHYIVRELPAELTAALMDLGAKEFEVVPEIAVERNGEMKELRADTHPSVLYVNYKSIVPETSEYVVSRVKIELSCLSMDEPVEKKTIRSFIAESVPNSEELAVDFPTVVPTRTFLEKLFLLHEEFQRPKPRSLRMSRHLYDLEKLMDTDFGLAALQDKFLYNEIIQHRNVFNHIDEVDYTTHCPEKVKFLPPIELIDDWHKDYDSLMKHFLYSNQENLSFEQLMKRMTELMIRVRSLE